MDETPSTPSSLSGVLDRLQDRGGGATVSVGDLLRAFGRPAFGPVLLVPSLIAILPVIGALPGVSLSMAAMSVLLTVQMLFGRSVPWLPQKLRDISLPADKLDTAIDVARPWVKRLEKLFKPRWTFLAEPPFRWLEALLANVLAAGMMIGALVPGGIVPPAVAMIVLALGLTTKDGLVVFVALVSTLAVGILGVGLFL